jgi:hypothetical protein
MNASGPEENRMEGMRMKGLRYGMNRHIVCQRNKYHLVEGIGLILSGKKLKKKTKNQIQKFCRGVTHALL